ncbi:mechanosensitive ion channel protein MscS [Microbacterium arborescens]|uniref:Mechanosensitive ion channel protein MscS n=1 Tax=Microbacterium arborescens TaxID=33883 RepID=A0ABX2WG56_9MICO|nr:mechanosensitive ion channel domain-containing protein [Microbacterium arborescens]OAZ39672.1 mechanosensitive ion channel protein MscS [Microbacterium arborescens]
MTTVTAAVPLAWEFPVEEFWKFLSEAGWNIVAVAGIVLGAFALSWLMRRLIARIVDRIVRGAKTRAEAEDTRAIDMSPLAQVRIVQRTRTLGSILTNIVNVTIVIVALLMVVGVLSPGILGSFTLLSAAIGAGLGFGAQNIVKDVLNGMFIVAEDQIGIGDVVDLGLATGIVEYVSVRVTHVRDVNGTLWFVRNGEITRIGNMSQGWSRVIIDLAVPTDADVEVVEKTVLDAAKDLAREPKWRSRIIEKPELWGLESISGDALVIRVVVKTRPNAKDDVARALRVRLKQAVDELGVKIPQLNSTILTGFEGAQSVRGANPPRTKPQPVAPPQVKGRPQWRPKRKGSTAATASPDARDSHAEDGNSPDHQKDTP